MRRSWLWEHSSFLLGVLVLTAMAAVTRSGLLLVVAGLLGVTGIVAFYWGAHALDRLEYRRRFGVARCFTGEPVELTVELTNRKLLPVTYLTVDEAVPEDLEIAARTLKFFRIGKGTLRLFYGLAWYQKVVRRYKVTPRRRGFYHLGPALIQGGDPFGFGHRDLQVIERESLIVYPRIVPLEQLGLPSERPFGDLKSQNRLFADPLRVAGVRDYQPGDPLNRIHWKASAASGQLQVTLLDPASHPGLAVFINTWGYDVYWQGTQPDALETGYTAAASIAEWACRNGVPVGVFANAMCEGWGLKLRIPSARGEGLLPHILEGLARLKMPSRDSLAEMLLEEGRGLLYGTSVVVITRLVSDDTVTALLTIRRTGRPVTLIIVGDANQAIARLPGVRIYQVRGEGELYAAALA